MKSLVIGTLLAVSAGLFATASFGQDAPPPHHVTHKRRPPPPPVHKKHAPAPHQDHHDDGPK
ncbi:hypothetical protein [Paraburkholderia sp.]|uniref:hypothetical protein n=1 Tax=Paraburkholderia sp. TaxID=1926495 RepID=UPI00239CC341|nr:hypothetical protein [Paraburkholderia sp.]MDE1178972.1 hypothetical protein [Paraburkholderia sp.]